MFIDLSGSLGAEHARDLRRAAGAFRVARGAAQPTHTLRAFRTRTQLGPTYNYRTR